MKHPKIRRVGNALFISLAVLSGFLGVLIYTSARWMLATWAHLEMEELIYHLKAPLEGTGQDVIVDYILSCALVSVGILIGCILVFVIFRKKKIFRILFGTFCILGGIASIAYSLHRVWTTLGVENYLNNQSEYSTIVEDNYVNPATAALTFPEQKRNLIYIYLESMESTYADKENGGAFTHNFIPALTKLANENINFSNSDKLGGAYTTNSTTWTMGGLFAQTSGLPLKIAANGNEMAYQDSFFPELTTLGDILEQAGYRQYFMMGSDAAFGGRKSYFTEHGNYELDDYYWAVDEGLIPSGYYEWWGYEDAKLFEYAKQKLTEIAQDSEPFNFSMLTVATHFEDGYSCDLCDKEQYGDDHYGMVIDCSSSRVAEFVEWIQQQDFYENTTVILSGDHLTMDSNFCENIDEDYHRSTYNAILNAPIQPANEKNRVFTTLDMFPTTLASLGVSIQGERLGLGTNLFSEKPTLSEEMGFDVLNKELSRRSYFFEELTADVKPVWSTDSEGRQKYYLHDEERYAVNQWVIFDPHQLWADGEQRYFIDEDGYMVKGWKQIGEEWYYFSESNGSLQRGPYDAPQKAN